MKDYQLNSEEKEMLKDLENGKFNSISRVADEITRVRDWVIKQNEGDKLMNIRISSSDISFLKKKALEEGLSHETLASGIIQKYVRGKLKEL